MNASAINHLLQVARMVRDAAKKTGNGATAVTALQAERGLLSDTPEFFKTISEIQKQLDDAKRLIESDGRMDSEGRDGLIQQIMQMKQMFSPPGLNNNTTSYVPNADVLVSQFAIISGFYSDSPAPYAGTEAGIGELIAEIDQLEGVISSSDQPPEVVGLINSQLDALKFFIRNVDLLGFDAAYSAYFDLVIRLRRVEKNVPATGAILAEVWPSVERWAGRLAIIEGLVSNSEKLIAAAENLHKLIP
jgi:hypothetical protein